MKRIKLTQNKYAIVDDEDFEYLSQWKWRYHIQGYAVRTKHISFIDGKQSKKEILMHRLLANPPKGMVTDHINRDKLDNRRSNLRVCTQAQNRLNSGISSHNKSGIKGVCFDNTRQKWIATAPKGKSLGRYNTLKEATLARINYMEATYGQAN